jgi:hypothetical protein
MMVFGVGFKVLSQAFDPFAEERNLNLGRSGISRMRAELLDHLTFASCFLCAHLLSLLALFVSLINTLFSWCKA